MTLFGQHTQRKLDLKMNLTLNQVPLSFCLFCLSQILSYLNFKLGMNIPACILSMQKFISCTFTLFNMFLILLVYHRFRNTQVLKINVRRETASILSKNLASNGRHVALKWAYMTMFRTTSVLDPLFLCLKSNSFVAQVPVFFAWHAIMLVFWARVFYDL
jgi:hypothetical protein